MLRSLALLGLLLTPCLAQDKALDDSVDGYLRTVVVTATRSPAVAFDTPYSAEAISGKQLARRAYRTLPQALRNVPGVMVQETAPGQGSPYIRGFTGYRTLFLIDGIRLNNSTWRAGPNQYTATVDTFSLARIEIVKGPSSVLFGSDAIGGTVNSITIGPYDLESGVGGRAYYRGATAENSHIGRGEVSMGLKGTTGAILGLTGKHFGDLIAGDNTRQTNTGYDELDGDFKAEHLLDEHTRLVLGFQHVDQDDVPRTHKTIFAVPFEGTTVGSELQRTHDQRRTLAYLQFHKEKIGGAVDSVRASLSYHDQSESRHRVRPPSGGGTEPREDDQGVDVGTTGFWAQASSDTPIGLLTYGFDYYHDDVDSYSSSNPVQGPVGDDATYDLLGLFVQDEVELGKRWAATAGLRFNYAAADAKSVSDPATGGTVRVQDDWSAVVGNLRAVYHLVPEKWNLFTGVSQGFRAPNLSDLTRFDSARTNEFEVPAPGLDPEHYMQFELGIKGQTDRLSLMFSGYYTDIRDQITRVPTGETTPDGDTVVTKANVGDGYAWGLEFGGAWRFAPQWTLFGNAAWIEGKVDTFPTSAPVVVREYMDRLMPLTGQLGVLWEPRDNVWVEALGIAAAEADRLSTRDAADTSRIPPGGTPAYAVLHLRAGWRPKEWLAVRVGIENILDTNYRIHGSGHNMPGRNFVFSVNFDF
jgi:hemoglobin/transferrin/lactoferrin receptor protein